jgi:hypothetical protein
MSLLTLAAEFATTTISPAGGPPPARIGTRGRTTYGAAYSNPSTSRFSPLVESTPSTPFPTAKEVKAVAYLRESERFASASVGDSSRSAHKVAQCAYVQGCLAEFVDDAVDVLRGTIDHLKYSPINEESLISIHDTSVLMTARYPRGGCRPLAPAMVGAAGSAAGGDAVETKEAPGVSETPKGYKGSSLCIGFPDSENGGKHSFKRLHDIGASVGVSITNALDLIRAKLGSEWKLIVKYNKKNGTIAQLGLAYA